MNLFQRKTQVLFVCSENICRSPLAEAILRHHLRQAGIDGRFKVSSAGTRVSQPGAKPDQRASRVAAEAGIRMGRIRARRVAPDDVVRSAHVFALGHSHLADLLEMSPVEHRHNITLLRSHLPGQASEDVPDPYYGSYQGFQEVFRLIDEAVGQLVREHPLFAISG